MRDDAALIRFNLSNKNFKILIHVLLWAALLALPFIMNYPQSAPRMPVTLVQSTSIFYLNLVNYFYWIALFYINIFVLIPYLFYRRRYIAYGLVGLLFYLLFLYFQWYLFKLFNVEELFEVVRSSWMRLPAFFLTMAASLAYLVISDKFKENLKIQKIESENMKSELSFLRSQISPHFIFNILNNIVALVRLQSRELEPTVMKLSGLMQYMLYKTDEEKVTLNVEQEYLNAYIDLQQQRFGNNVKIQTCFDIKDQQKQIEPMLLIPFVENAFKHGVGVIEKPEITVIFKADEFKLNFTVINNYNDVHNKQKDPSSGIGIVNVSRRIALLYGDSQTLHIQKKNNCFKVDLNIYFDQNKLHSS